MHTNASKIWMKRLQKQKLQELAIEEEIQNKQKEEEASA